MRPFTTGLVLAAGGSQRLGRPKQLLEYRGRTLLDATLDSARRCRFDQLVVALGGASDDVRATVDLSGCDVVDSPHHRSGCSSSIVASLTALDRRSEALVILLGDQPGIAPTSVDALRAAAAAAGAAVAVCRYEDGRGHPFWFDRSLFADLADLHGDKAVWKLLESGRYDVAEAIVEGAIPIDVDTWADYERLLELR